MSRRRRGLRLDWWQARREAVTQAYGVTVARVAAITYGKRPTIRRCWTSGIGRAEAMAYRDARGQAMTDPDWWRSSPVTARLPVAEAAVAGGDS
jgi:hypothetical protein